jgi:acetylornithine deacetylase/succinyl-diaminopimelate desuccinylase family protein
MINKNRLINLTKELIRINSENPPGRELEIANFVLLIMRQVGFKIIKSYAFEKNRPNVIGVLKGKRSTKVLLLSPHLDTVPAGKNWKHNPFKPVLLQDKLFGRGATDCKGNLAVCLEVCRSLIEDNFKPKFDLIIAATADEETGSKLGMIKLLDKKILKPDFALILDSDDFRVIICQKGLIHFKVKIFGIKAHGAYPDRGVNAIEIASRVICDLKNLDFKFNKHPFLKAPTVNIGKISGGEKVNIVADFCEFEVDLRFLPGMKPGVILKHIKKIIRSRAKRFSLQVDSIQQPYEISKNHYLIKGLLNSDRRFNLGGSEGATVITFFKKHNIPAAATGFGSSGCAHTADEFVSVDNLYKGALALEKFIKNFDPK